MSSARWNRCWTPGRSFTSATKRFAGTCFARFWRYCCARNWKTVWRARSGSWNGPTSSGIWTTSLRWKSRSAARVTFFAARLPAWRARSFKHAVSPCHPRYAHAELIFNSTQAERKRVTRPFSKLQPIGNGPLPPAWCRRRVKDHSVPADSADQRPARKLRGRKDSESPTVNGGGRRAVRGKAAGSLRGNPPITRDGNQSRGCYRHAIARTEVDPGVRPWHIGGHVDRDSPRRDRCNGGWCFRRRQYARRRQLGQAGLGVATAGRGSFLVEPGSLVEVPRGRDASLVNCAKVVQRRRLAGGGGFAIPAERLGGIAWKAAAAALVHLPQPIHGCRVARLGSNV